MWNPRIKNLTKMVADLRRENYNRLQSIELLTARVEALEAAQQQPQLDQSLAPPIGVKPQWLVDEERLGELEAAIKRYEDRGVPVLIDWVVEASEIRDRQQQRRKDLGLREKVDLIVQVEEHGQQPDHIADASKMVDTGWQDMADGSPIMEPAPPAPAEGLVERVAWRLANHNHDSNPEIWRPEARETIREIAGWLRSKLIGNRWLVGPFIADRLEQEAER